MKRFTVITALFSVSIVSILAVGVIFKAFASSPSEAKSNNTPIKVNDGPDEMLKAKQSGDLAVPVTVLDMKIAPVFDTTGALTSDPTGTLLNANHSGNLDVPAVIPAADYHPGSEWIESHSLTGADMKIAPVFDTTGALTSDPTGTMLNANHSGDLAVPAVIPAVDYYPGSDWLESHPLTGANMKIAPVFDTTGAITSDPTGTILSVINP